MKIPLYTNNFIDFLDIIDCKINFDFYNRDYFKIRFSPPLKISDLIIDDGADIVETVCYDLVIRIERLLGGAYILHTDKEELYHIFENINEDKRYDNIYQFTRNEIKPKLESYLKG